MPLRFNSSSAGILQISAINITFDYPVNETYLFKRSAYFWNQTASVVPNASLEIWYSVNSTANNISAPLSTIGYFLDDNSSTSCRVNGTLYTPSLQNLSTGNKKYCPAVISYTQGNKWSDANIWNGSSKMPAVNMTVHSINQNFSMPNNISQMWFFKNNTLTANSAGSSQTLSASWTSTCEWTTCQTSSGTFSIATGASAQVNATGYGDNTTEADGNTSSSTSWYRLFNVTNASSIALYNITAWFDISNDIAAGTEYMKIKDTSGHWVTTTPTTDCDTNSWTNFTINNSLWQTCYNDTVANGAAKDYFKFIIPLFRSPAEAQGGGIPSSQIFVSLRSPANASWNTTDDINFGFQPNSSGYITGADLWTNISGSWAKNASNTSAISNNSVNNIQLADVDDGSLFWGINLSDAAGNWTFSPHNFTLYIDTVAPTVTILSPPNATNTSNTIQLMYTRSETNEVNSGCLYNVNDGGNITLAACANTTFFAPEGNNNVRVWANDTAGSWGTAIVYFSVDTGAPAISLQSPPTASTNYSDDIYFQFLANDTNSIEAADLWTNLSGVWTKNSSNASVVLNNTLYSFAYADINDGSVVWNVNVSDTNFFWTFPAANWSLNIHTIADVRSNVSYLVGGGGTKPTFLNNMTVVANVTPTNTTRWVNFTVTGPNGTRFSNQNGTQFNNLGGESGALWNSSAFLIDRVGQWRVNITAGNGQGETDAQSTQQWNFTITDTITLSPTSRTQTKKQGQSDVFNLTVDTDSSEYLNFSLACKSNKYANESLCNTSIFTISYSPAWLNVSNASNYSTVNISVSHTASRLGSYAGNLSVVRVWDGNESNFTVNLTVANTSADMRVSISDSAVAVPYAGAFTFTLNASNIGGDLDTYGVNCSASPLGGYMSYNTSNATIPINTSLNISVNIAGTVPTGSYNPAFTCEGMDNVNGYHVSASQVMSYVMGREPTVISGAGGGGGGGGVTIVVAECDNDGYCDAMSESDVTCYSDCAPPIDIIPYNITLSVSEGRSTSKEIKVVNNRTRTIVASFFFEPIGADAEAYKHAYFVVGGNAYPRLDNQSLEARGPISPGYSYVTILWAWPVNDTYNITAASGFVIRSDSQGVTQRWNVKLQAAAPTITPVFEGVGWIVDVVGDPQTLWKIGGAIALFVVAFALLILPGRRRKKEGKKWEFLGWR